MDWGWYDYYDGKIPAKSVKEMLQEIEEGNDFAAQWMKEAEQEYRKAKEAWPRRLVETLTDFVTSSRDNLEKIFFYYRRRVKRRMQNWEKRICSEDSYRDQLYIHGWAEKNYFLQRIEPLARAYDYITQDNIGQVSETDLVVATTDLVLMWQNGKKFSQWIKRDAPSSYIAKHGVLGLERE